MVIALYPNVNGKTTLTSFKVMLIQQGSTFEVFNFLNCFAAFRVMSSISSCTLNPLSSSGVIGTSLSSPDSSFSTDWAKEENIEGGRI